MNFDKIIEKIKTAKLAGITFQKEGQARYRDRITVYFDGKLLFERFCYGEAAGLVFDLHGKCVQPIDWDYNSCAHSQKEDAPKELTDFQNNNLYFDDKTAAWQEKELLKTDSKNGYSFLKMLFAK